MVEGYQGPQHVADTVVLPVMEPATMLLPEPPPLPTFDEVADSLTGFDEIAIETLFRRPLSELVKSPTMFQRGVAMVLKRREGMADADAYRSVMLMSFAQVRAMFAAEPEADAMGEEPGKALP